MNIATLLFLIMTTAVSAFAANSNLPAINGQRIDDLRSSYATLTVRYEGILSNIGRLTGRFDEFEHTANKLSSNINGNGLKINNLSKKITSVGNKLDKLELKIVSLSKSIDKLQQLLASSANGTKNVISSNRSNGKGLSAPPIVAKRSQTPETKIKLLPITGDYGKAMEFLKQKKFKNALNLLSKFIKDNPQDKRIAMAYFQKGEIYFALEQYDSAIIDYDQVVTRFPRFEKIATAMLKEGICFSKLNDSIDAKYLLNKVIQGFPGSDQAKRALLYLKKIK